MMAQSCSVTRINTYLCRMRKQFKKTSLRLDSEGNVFGNNGNVIYAANGLYHGKYTLNEMMKECFPETIEQPTKESEPKITKKIKDKEACNATRNTKGINNSKFTGYFVINGIEYETVRHASLATGIRANTISKFCKLGMSFKPV